jgi:hypothetical protein
MRQRIDHRGVDGEERIEEVGQVDPVRFRNQAKQLAVTIEAPRPTGLADFQRGLAVRYRSTTLGLPAGSL